MTEPTPEMLARDLDADLARIRKAACGAMHAESFRAEGRLYYDDYDLCGDIHDHLAYGVSGIHLAEMFAAAAQGWEAAILRAKAAEKRLAVSETCQKTWEAMCKHEQELEATLELTSADAEQLRAVVNRLHKAIAEHHAQKADDRCIEDDDRLYAAAGLPPCDRRVGDKFEMAKNCLRFIENRCQGGGWPTYREMEEKVRRLEAIALWQGAELTEAQAAQRLGLAGAVELRAMWLALIQQSPRSP